LHQAGTTTFASGIATQAGFLLAQSQCGQLTVAAGASDEFAHVSDSTSIVLSPRHNLLACAGLGGTAQLWDTESHQPFHVPFKTRRLFSPDGRYLAYGGTDMKITLWTVGMSLLLVKTFKMVCNRSFYPSRRYHLLSMSVFSLFTPRHTHNLTGR